MSHAAFFGDQQAIADWVVELMDRGLSDEEIWQDVTGIAGNDSKRRLAAGGEYYSSI